MSHEKESRLPLSVLEGIQKFLSCLGSTQTQRTSTEAQRLLKQYVLIQASTEPA